ncbi:MAG: hypothetical protein AAFV88_12780 [Planctomycetota bacterium]
MAPRPKLILLKLLLAISLFTSLNLLAQGTANAQNDAAAKPKSLMDKMTGHWVMTGTIAGEQVTHDVNVDWILGRRYIRIHEASREKTKTGELEYEAWIHIAWDEENAEFVLMWLDNTGTTNFAAEGVGHGKPNGEAIPFIWKFADGSGIHNTFSYDRENDSWSWSIDNVDEAQGHSKFARLVLKRRDNQ